MKELAALLTDPDFQTKLLDHDNVESDRDFEWKLESANSYLQYLWDVVATRQARLRSARGEKVETNG